jgi:hypothetical protein
MIATEILRLLPLEEVSQKDYATIRSTMKKVFLHTEQMYLEWGRQSQPQVSTRRKRNATQQPITRWMTAGEDARRRVTEPREEETETDTGTDDESQNLDLRMTQRPHDKRQWDR